ncbi:MAG TPA: peptidase M28 [Verrucomicrobia bacterium]|nr:MAG: hypothetical protein A2X46_19205 [Lentisphaerae bacterium GWF2_57_35]HBA85126.1 peptidase M28 [Verrucomicrobiota bacterium]
MKITRHSLQKSILRVALAVVAVVLVAWVLIAQPTWAHNRRSAERVSSGRLEAHVRMLSETYCPRNWLQTQNLDRCAAYIAGELIRAGASVEDQLFKVGDSQYRNVIGRFGKSGQGKVVVGAHYDSYGDTPGADDNASGVAAFIELAYLLGRNPLQGEVELVAYALEEPPFFKGPQMGSSFHAQRLAEQNESIKGVLVFEMVGYFQDDLFTQSYPSLLLHIMYPHRGNFIGVVGKSDQGDWIKAVKAGMKNATSLPVFSIRAPAMLPGVDFSDHLNYWKHGFPAVMISDTAFYRNKAYHTANDTLNRLDFDRLGKVVVAVFEAIKKIDAPPQSGIP